MPTKSTKKKSKSSSKNDESVVITATPAPSTAAETVSARTLERAPERALQFLRGVGTNEGIKAALLPRGFTDQDHDEGWDLVHAVCGYSKPSGGTTSGENPVRDAINELGKDGEPMLRVLRAAIQHKFPQFMGPLFDGLESTAGPGWILVVSQLIKRINALADAGKEGKAALKLIADRGYPETELARLAALVATAESFGPAPTPIPDPTDYNQALLALYNWISEWSQIAKVAIKRRDWLILLGLATRKSPTEPPPAPEPTPAPAPTDSYTSAPRLPVASTPEASHANGRSPAPKP